MHRIDSYSPKLLAFYEKPINNIIASLPQPLSTASIRQVLYDHYPLFLPVSYFPYLTIRPVIYFNAMMNLRYLSGIGDILFTRLVEFIDLYKHSVLTQSDFIHLIERVSGNKPVDLRNVNEIFSRIYACCQSLQPNCLGVDSNTLISMLSALYPNNTAVGLRICERWKGPIVYSTLKTFLECVYCVLDEFFLCFDVTVVTLDQIAANVATACFQTFGLSTSDSLSQDQFMQWLKSNGPFSISKDSSVVSVYPHPNRSQESLLTYDVLSQAVSPQLLQASGMYASADASQADLQMYGTMARSNR